MKILILILIAILVNGCNLDHETTTDPKNFQLSREKLAIEIQKAKDGDFDAMSEVIYHYSWESNPEDDGDNYQFWIDFAVAKNHSKWMCYKSWNFAHSAYVSKELNCKQKIIQMESAIEMNMKARGINADLCGESSLESINKWLMLEKEKCV